MNKDRYLVVVSGPSGCGKDTVVKTMREKHPEICLLNREDDMGLEGLRRAKLSYQPHHFEEKYWACLMEDLHGEGCAEEALD